MAVASTLLIAVVVWQPAHWPLLVAGGVLCASPDLMWFPKFWRSMRGDNTVRAENRLMAFHRVIQWAERPWGAYVEAIWFLAVGSAVLAKTMY